MSYQMNACPHCGEVAPEACGIIAEFKAIVATNGGATGPDDPNPGPHYWQAIYILTSEAWREVAINGGCLDAEGFEIFAAQLMEEKRARGEIWT